MITSARRLSLLLLIAVLAVAGCSGDDESAGPSTSGDITDDPVMGSGTAASDTDNSSEAGDPSLAADMIRVEGTASEGSLDAALDGTISGPFTLEVPSAGGGNGAVFNPVSVDGDTKSIVWDGGRPLSLTGPDLAFDGRWTIDGGSLAFDLASNPLALPAGAYTVVGPVAVGDPSGLATPADQVTFVAGPDTGILGTGQSSVAVPADGVLLGPGSLDLHGTFTVTTSTDTVTASTIRLENGSFEITVAESGDGVAVTGLAQGAGWS